MSLQVNRLPSGGLPDRNTSIRFRFDGKDCCGFAGDTLASALLACGVKLFGRSFKYHRPRGLWSAGPEEPNALVELRKGARREPNTRATVVELFEGLEAQSQNRWPSLAFDVQAVNGWFAPLFGAGFYYKTFMWPAVLWEKLYEPVIRRAAGLGRASEEPDPDSYEKCWRFCDVLVVGAGAAGLMAALAAGRAGARVILADEDFRAGGRCLAEQDLIDGLPGAEWVNRVLAELRTLPDVHILGRTTVFGAFDDGVYGAVERVSDHLAVPLAQQPRQRLWRIAAKRVVLASGAIERAPVFGNNDLPGVMLAGAVRAYLNRFGVLPGKRAVVFTDNDDGWRTAADLQRAGAVVEAVVDPRSNAPALPGMRHVRGVITQARGGRMLRAVDVVADGRNTRLRCDLLAVSGGWMPSLHLASHRGHRPRFDDARGLFLPEALPGDMRVAGAAAGAFTLAEALASGQAAGLASARDIGFSAKEWPLPECSAQGSAREPLWISPGARGRCFVDLQNDVTSKDIDLAKQEGFTSVEHLKRYTTLGMATDQGKTSGVSGIALLAAATGRSIAATGTTTFRPPYTPVALGALAGPHRGREFRPTRLTPSHAWAERRGAVFVEAGEWLRAQYFPQPGETDWLESVTREATAVRNAVGVCDVSTLGKIEVQGPDALALLERVYANRLDTLTVGRARYALMLREDGIVMDDGTVARIAPERYFVTTTTANAGAVWQHLQFCHQVLWPELDAQLCSVTEHWAQFAVAGPRARLLLERVADPGQDISNSGFPYLAAGAFRVLGGVRGRLYRLSFSGELAYEIAVPAQHGEALLAALFAAGEDLGVTPYGTETLGVLRIEKGHPAGGELSGQTTAHDLGLGRLLSRNKDYIGAVLAHRAALIDTARPRLVGIKPADRLERLYAGAHFIAADAPATAAHDEGYVTSVAFSPALGHWVGLGLLARGPERHGEHLRACDPLRGREIRVEVCDPVFLDPDGGRLRG